jgi:hypothetical protein
LPFWTVFGFLVFFVICLICHWLTDSCTPATYIVINFTKSYVEVKAAWLQVLTFANRLQFYWQHALRIPTCTCTLYMICTLPPFRKFLAVCYFLVAMCECYFSILIEISSNQHQVFYSHKSINIRCNAYLL